MAMGGRYGEGYLLHLSLKKISQLLASWSHLLLDLRVNPLYLVFDGHISKYSGNSIEHMVYGLAALFFEWLTFLSESGTSYNVTHVRVGLADP